MTPDSAPRRLVRAEAVLAARRRDVTLVLEDVLDRHNISAVLRTCEAFGIQDVHLVACTETPAEINPAVAIGAERWLTVHRHDGVPSAITALRSHGYRLYVGHLSPEAIPLATLPREGRAAYVFGSEHRGISPAWLAAADARFVIPTTGFTGSLNLSVAAALVVYDRLCVAAPFPAGAGDLEPGEMAELRAAWYEMLAHGSAAVAGKYKTHLQHPPVSERLFPIDRNRT